MKKFSALLLILVLMLSIVGCNTPSSNDKEGKIIEAYCYVVHVKSNGFVASIDLGANLVQHFIKRYSRYSRSHFWMQKPKGGFGSNRAMLGQK